MPLTHASHLDTNSAAERQNFHEAVGGAEPSMVARRKMLSAVSTFLLLFPGCAATYGAHPDFHQKRDRIRTIGVLSPRADVFQLDIADTKKMENWSSEAEKNLLAAILEEFKSRTGFLTKTLEDSSLDKATPDLAETHGLFQATGSMEQRAGSRGQ
jgi:hypothetical protein